MPLGKREKGRRSYRISSDTAAAIRADKLHVAIRAIRLT
jgi:hypothetical protein